ncbi:hypothetical protein [uncultured Enterovirga sp.]|uniref:hypothetical protein n=1 Tax=uncultured Enterovirga sp. TaxID=2026352 RepID=UPI0035C9915B
MTTRTVTAMFDRYADATAAVTRLETAGIPHDNISLVSNDETERSRFDTASGTTSGTGVTGRDHPSAETGTGTGASVGTALGAGAGLLAGLGLLAIPGLGPVVAAGWLASTLVGAGVGAATGGIVGALTGAGIDEAGAHSYAEGIRRGGTLLTVRADDAHYAKVVDILDDEGTVDMNQREASWKSEGWTGRDTGTDYAPGTTGSLSGGPVGAAASTTTGLGTGAPLAGEEVGGMRSGGRTRVYPAV